MKKQILAAGIAAMTAFGLTACGSSAAAIPEVVRVENAENRVITVSSTETVKVVPDVAEIVYGISTEADNAETCQQKNQEDVGKVVDLLKQMGIAEESIQTSGYGMNPRYDWSNNTQVLIGYEMLTQITVSDLAIDQVGAIINDSVSAGVNNIQSVTYKSSKYDENYQEALKLAVESAKIKAEAMAEAGGFALDGVAHIEEYETYQEARYTNYSLSGARDMVAEASAMEVMPGQVDVEARISVDFKIAD